MNESLKRVDLGRGDNARGGVQNGKLAVPVFIVVDLAFTPQELRHSAQGCEARWDQSARIGEPQRGSAVGRGETRSGLANIVHPLPRVARKPSNPGLYNGTPAG